MGKHGQSASRGFRGLVTSLVTAVCLLAPTITAGKKPTSLRDWDKPIVLDRTGGFQIGGTRITNPANSSRHLSCDHGYMEYFLPWKPRKTSLVMWHSSSTQVWQNRWDGGQGFKDLFLRRNYPVYLWDGPRVGRANWACVNVTYVPTYRDEDNFPSWNFGTYYPNWWDDAQFPEENREAAWLQATSARYDEFDTWENVVLHAKAASVAADSGRVGDNIVYLTNSAGGFRAQMTAIMSQKNNIKGIYTYESIGYVFPDNAPNITADTKGGFGPAVVPVDDFKKLAKVPAIRFLWGDHRDRNTSFIQDSIKCADYINQYGGNAEVIMLGEVEGLHGNSHIPFADMNNAKIAGLLDDFLEENDLDGYLGRWWPFR